MLLFILFLTALMFHGGTCERTPEEWRQFEDEKAKDMMKEGRKVVWYQGTLTCPLDGFCAAFYYEEEDSYASDYLMYVGVHCTNTNILQHSTMVMYEGGDGFFDYNYETRLRILHDCDMYSRNMITIVGVNDGFIDRIPDTPEALYLRRSYTIALKLESHDVTPPPPKLYGEYYTIHGYKRHHYMHKWNYKTRGMTYTPEETYELMGYKRQFIYEKNRDSKGYDVCVSTTVPLRDCVCKHHYT